MNIQQTCLYFAAFGVDGGLQNQRATPKDLHTEQPDGLLLLLPTTHSWHGAVSNNHAHVSSVPSCPASASPSLSLSLFFFFSLSLSLSICLSLALSLSLSLSVFLSLSLSLFFSSLSLSLFFSSLSASLSVYIYI